MTAPAWCPNMGVDCKHPDCTLLEAECATAQAYANDRADIKQRAPLTDDEKRAAKAAEEAAQPVRVVPPTKPGEMPTLFPITADEIFKGK